MANDNDPGSVVAWSAELKDIDALEDELMAKGLGPAGLKTYWQTHAP